MGLALKKSKVYDQPFTFKIVNEKMNYDFENDYLTSGSYETNEERKNGYLAVDLNGEELGIVFEDDKEKNPYYQCANILFFKTYKEKHNVGKWRIIRPIDRAYYTNDKGYISFSTLEEILLKDGSLTVTTKSTFHYS